MARVCAEPILKGSTTRTMNSFTFWKSASLSAVEPSNRKARSMARSHPPAGIMVEKGSTVEVAKPGLAVVVGSVSTAVQSSQLSLLFSQ